MRLIYALGEVIFPFILVELPPADVFKVLLGVRLRRR
jgi:hypothetical protein